MTSLKENLVVPTNTSKLFFTQMGFSTRGGFGKCFVHEHCGKSLLSTSLRGTTNTIDINPGTCTKTSICRGVTLQSRTRRVGFLSCNYENMDGAALHELHHPSLHKGRCSWVDQSVCMIMSSTVFSMMQKRAVGGE